MVRLIKDPDLTVQTEFLYISGSAVFFFVFFSKLTCTQVGLTVCNIVVISKELIVAVGGFVNFLTFTTLYLNSADDKLSVFLLFFSWNRF